MRAPRLGVVFDCDSTLSTVEGIDELASRAGVRAEVEALTRAAMDGTVPLEAVYGRRLDLIRPRREDIAAIAAHYCQALVPGARETVAALRAAGVAVALVSGGLEEALRPLAQLLDIEALHAVPLLWDENGHYRGVGPSPLTTARGKAEVVASWRAQQPSLERVLMVGDGMSDAAARAPGAADEFWAFVGVVERPAVLATADRIIRRLAEIPALLR